MDARCDTVGSFVEMKMKAAAGLTVFTVSYAAVMRAPRFNTFISRIWNMRFEIYTDGEVYAWDLTVQISTKYHVKYVASVTLSLLHGDVTDALSLLHGDVIGTLSSRSWGGADQLHRQRTLRLTRHLSGGHAEGCWLHVSTDVWPKIRFDREFICNIITHKIITIIIT